MPTDRIVAQPRVITDLPGADAKPTTALVQQPVPAAIATPVDQATRVVSAENDPTTAATFVAARNRQTSDARLRAGLARALSSELLMPTDVAAEALASKAMAALNTSSLSPGSIVEAALATGGPLAVAGVVSALAWRIDAAAADTPTAERSDFEKGAGRALEELVGAAIKRLGQAKPATIPDAVHTMVALSALLSSGQTNYTAYYAPADTSYAHHFDAFTNEQGLPAAIAKLPQTGGALVGVSGGALQIAAQIGADLAVISDINPEVRDFTLVLGTTALMLSDRAQAEHWDDGRFVSEVSERMLGPKRGAAAFLDELRAAGLPEPILKRTPRMLAGLFNDSGANERQIWFAAKDTVMPGIATRVDAPDAQIAGLLRNVASLARKGSLAAGVVDLSDGDGVGRVRQLVEAHGSSVAAVHLSNALEYVTDPVAVVDHVTALPVRSDAVVLSSSGSGYPDPRIGDWYVPGVNPITTWTEPNGIRAAFVGQQDVLASRAWRKLVPAAFLDPQLAWEKAPTTLAGARAELERLTAEHYANPDAAYGSLLMALGIRSGSQRYSAGLDKLMALGVPAPRNPDEVRAFARKLHDQFLA
jgi:hypothetical protein